MTTPLIGTTSTKVDSPQGGSLHERDRKGELFIAAVSTLGGTSAYEDDETRAARIKGLVKAVALEDPQWVMRFSRWLRDEANIRTMSSTMACEFIKARLDAFTPDETPAHVPGMNRTTINVACLRADEPSKIIEYWHDNYGRALPSSLKRGLADAVQRLYTERSALRYDTPALKVRFGDVIELVHPKAKDDKQAALFEWLLDRRHGRKETPQATLDMLPMVKAAEAHRAATAVDRDAERERLLTDPSALKSAGLTWENLSGLGKMDARAWEAVIPSMGYMALLRNLRNFDEAGISRDAADYVSGRLTDRDEVKNSRQLPFRFYSAYKTASSAWHDTLEHALNLCVPNIPTLEGRTLCLVDCSGSMGYVDSHRGTMSFMEKAALFGTVLKKRNEDRVTLVRYGTDSALVSMRPGVLETLNRSYKSMGGTDTAGAVEEWLRSDGPFDRVVILTDEQTTGYSSWGLSQSVDDVVPEDVMLYTWNLAGYRGAHAKASPTRHSFGGLTDQGFAMIPLIEAGVDASWPF